MNSLCELAIYLSFLFFLIELSKSIWVSSKSHRKQFFGKTNLKSPLQNKNEITKKPSGKEFFKKQ